LCKNVAQEKSDAGDLYYCSDCAKENLHIESNLSKEDKKKLFFDGD